ncbi:hypothetical protein RO3G_07734 [Rhizopus delemar RA 99-880]|uniref:Uncharacterized protein n=1 Tax=Rhizopus delemar (strain RA 99-880 / ATCC MYA-4621 / FGSC 9543 / NRRL 43880) TaxID=246409 RepID=I1C3J9_RHIO9|nr:hypothetical protein RO3G_07734 [Rhizopus delemar RA 99-880]KAG1182981.1 hypothetical protein G6F36_008781 [Rhizopus arrhizus]|eukprot:EIE83029.1 hypothetical protein RO3G_07734 [Rhizopus delemar RA 99-880]
MKRVSVPASSLRLWCQLPPILIRSFFLPFPPPIITTTFQQTTIQTIANDAVKQFIATTTKISAERSTISTSEDLEVGNFEKLAPESAEQTVSSVPTNKQALLTSSAVETPQKRLFSDRTPPLLPVDTFYRPSLGKPKKNRQMTTSMDIIPETSGQLTLAMPENLNFGLTTLPNVKTLPQSSSEILSSAEHTQLSAHAPTPDWVSSIMARFNQYDDRLSQLEHLVAENQRLRKELHSATLRIQELEQQTVVIDDFPALEPEPKLAQGSEASRWANTLETKPTVDSTQSTSLSFLAAATKGQKATPPPKGNKPKRSRRITPRQYQAITRAFSPVSDSSGYQYIYLPSRYREPISSLRAKLRKLKINNTTAQKISA